MEKETYRKQEENERKKKKKQKPRVVNEIPLSVFETIVTPFCLFNKLFFRSIDGTLHLRGKMQLFLPLTDVRFSPLTRLFITSDHPIYNKSAFDRE